MGVVFLTLLASAAVEAITGFEPHFRAGAVYARALIMSENGNPIYVEYDTDGSIVSEIGEVKGELADLRLMSGTEFRSYINVLEGFRTTHAEGIAKEASLTSAAEYKGQTFLTVDGEEMVKPSLKPSTKVVLVRAKAQRFLPDAGQLVLLEFPVDLKAHPSLTESVQSLLLREDGTIHRESEFNIGFKVGFFGDDPERTIGRARDDVIHGPVGGVALDMGFFVGGKSVSAPEDGRYSMVYFVPPCPGFTFEYTTPIFAELRYRNFSPRGSPTIPYYLQREDYTYCNGLGASPLTFTLTGLMAQIAVLGRGSGPSINTRADFPVDVMVLTGVAEVTNDGTENPGAVSVGDDTSYDPNVQSFDPIARENFDFDGDEEPDIAVLGKLVESDGKTLFQADSAGPLQGIYLSGGDRRPDADEVELRQPDFTRLADAEAYFSSQGLLSSLSLDDLRNTDIYVFRQSNGKLVTERRGLEESDIGSLVSSGENADAGNFYYRILIRGPADYLSFRGRAYRDFADWQSKAKMAPELHERNSDVLRSGEPLEVIAINRATGYIGTTTTTLKSANEGGVGEISFPIDDIRLRPPNLKIWARRAYEVELGLTRGERRENIIGYEGSGLASDQYIEVRTEWFDADGNALPEELGDFGYTGRLARVSGDGDLSSVGGDLAQFAIEPGVHLQLVSLGDRLLGKQHFYIHVSGEPEDRNPDFGVGGVGEGPLQYRPDRYVPVLVQVFDEVATIDQDNLYRDLKREDPDLDLEKPAPVYRYVYRPEYQFSVFDLDVTDLSRGVVQDNGSEELIDVLREDDPIIGSSDDFMQALYSLMGSEFERLAVFGPTPELVLAFGEEEQSIPLGDDQTIRFTNLAHLASLQPVDFLSLRLYSNNDTENILWEYAFGVLSLLPAQGTSTNPEDNEILVSADELAVEERLVITAFLDKPSSRDNSQVIAWTLSGDGTVEPRVSESREGNFSTELTLPPVTDATAVVIANLRGSEARFSTATYKVVPGLAASIEVERSGIAAIGEMGEIELSLTVKDQFGNAVEDGTPVSVFAPDLIVEGETELIEGKTTLRIRGDDVDGLLPVELSVHNFEQTETVNIADIEVSFVNLDNFPVNTPQILRLQATSAVADLSGLTLELAAHRGRFSSNVVTLDSTNQAVVVYEPGRYRGFAQASVLISGTTRVNSQAFNVIEDTEDFLENNVLVVDGSGSINLGNGGVLNYGPSTDLVISAEPGEIVNPSLVDIFTPPTYAIQDYNADVGQIIDLQGDTTVLDISSGIDAQANHIRLVGANLQNFAQAWELSPETDFDVPSHPSTDNAEEAGINFWIRLPSLPSNDFTLVDWDDLGLALEVNADGTLTLSGRLASGSSSVTSSDSLVAGQWHQVAAHFYAGELRLGLDGTEHTQATGGPLAPARVSSYALRISSENTLTFAMAGIKTYDWNREAKLQFAGGQFETSVVADATGAARVPVTAQPSVVAYSRMYHQTDTFYAQMGQVLLPTAYAAQTTQECVQSFDPISPDAPDPLVAEAERFFKVVLKCFILPEVEEARIKYSTARGFRNKAVSLVRLTVYEGVYDLVEGQANSVVIFANCLDATLTGSNSSAVGATCDFITSMLAIGDIRDLLIQGYHYYLGDQKNYDALTVKLAGLGLLFDAIQLIPGVGNTAGVAVNAIIAGSKIIAKFLKIIGPTGIKAGRLIGRKLGEIIDVLRNPTISGERKLRAVRIFLPFIQIAAAATIIYQEEPKVFRFLAAAISSPQTFDNIITWFDSYLTDLENELFDPLVKAPQLDWLQFLVRAAYAQSTNQAVDVFIKVLRRLLKDAPNISPNELARRFNTALADFLKHSGGNVRYAFGGVKNSMLVIRAFMNVHEIAGGSGVRALALNRGWTIGLNARFSIATMLEVIGDVDLEKLFADLGVNGVRGLAGEFNKLTNDLLDPIRAFSFAKGHMANVLAAIDVLKRTDMQLLGVEVYRGIKEIGEALKLGARSYDLQVEINGRTINVELKNRVEGRVVRSIKEMFDDVVQEKSQDVVPGQLFNDLVRYMDNNNAGYQLWLTPDAIPGSRVLTGPLDPGVVKELEDKIIDEIKKQVVANQAKIARYLKIDLGTSKGQEALDMRLDELFDALDGNGPDQMRYVRIYTYDQIVP